MAFCLLYWQINVLFSYHQGFLLLQQMVTNTETMSRKWEALKHSILNRMSSSNPYIQGFHLWLQPCRDTCHPHSHYIHSVWEDLNSKVLRRYLGLPFFRKDLLAKQQTIHAYYCIYVFCIFFSPTKLTELQLPHLCPLLAVVCLLCKPHFPWFMSVYKCKKSQGFLAVLAKLAGKSKLQTIFYVQCASSLEKITSYKEKYRQVTRYFESS